MLAAYKNTEFVQTNKWSYLRAWLKLLQENKGSFLSRLCMVRVLFSSTLRWPLIWYSYDWRNTQLPPFWFYSWTCADVWPLCDFCLQTLSSFQDHTVPQHHCFHSDVARISEIFRSAGQINFLKLIEMVNIYFTYLNKYQNNFIDVI